MVCASLFFYAYWKLTYLPILLGSIVCNYLIARAILGKFFIFRQQQESIRLQEVIKSQETINLQKGIKLNMGGGGDIVKPILL